MKSASTCPLKYALISAHQDWPRHISGSTIGILPIIAQYEKGFKKLQFVKVTSEGVNVYGVVPATEVLIVDGFHVPDKPF